MASEACDVGFYVSVANCKAEETGLDGELTALRAAGRRDDAWYLLILVDTSVSAQTVDHAMLSGIFRLASACVQNELHAAPCRHGRRVPPYFPFNFSLFPSPVDTISFQHAHHSFRPSHFYLASLLPPPIPCRLPLPALCSGRLPGTLSPSPRGLYNATMATLTNPIADQRLLDQFLEKMKLPITDILGGDSPVPPLPPPRRQARPVSSPSPTPPFSPTLREIEHTYKGPYSLLVGGKVSEFTTPPGARKRKREEDPPAKKRRQPLLAETKPPRPALVSSPARPSPPKRPRLERESRSLSALASKPVEPRVESDRIQKPERDKEREKDKDKDTFLEKETKNESKKDAKKEPRKEIRKEPKKDSRKESKKEPKKELRKELKKEHRKESKDPKKETKRLSSKAEPMDIDPKLRTSRRESQPKADAKRDSKKESKKDGKRERLLSVPPPRSSTATRTLRSEPAAPPKRASSRVPRSEPTDSVKRSTAAEATENELPRRKKDSAALEPKRISSKPRLSSDASTGRKKESDSVRDRGRDRGRDRDRDRDRSREREDRERRRSSRGDNPVRDDSRERYQARDRDFERNRPMNRDRDSSRDRDVDRDRGSRDPDRKRDRDRDSDWDRDRDRDREELRRNSSHDTERGQSRSGRERDGLSSREKERLRADSTRARKGRENDDDRDRDRDRDRYRERDGERDREKDRERGRDRDREGDRSKDGDRDRDRGSSKRDRAREKDMDLEWERRKRDRDYDRDRSGDRDNEVEREHSRTRERPKRQERPNGLRSQPASRSDSGRGSLSGRQSPPDEKEASSKRVEGSGQLQSIASQKHCITDGRPHASNVTLAAVKSRQEELDQEFQKLSKEMDELYRRKEYDEFEGKVRHGFRTYFDLCLAKETELRLRETELRRSRSERSSMKKEVLDHYRFLTKTFAPSKLRDLENVGRLSLKAKFKRGTQKVYFRMFALQRLFEKEQRGVESELHNMLKDIQKVRHDDQESKIGQAELPNRKLTLLKQLVDDYRNIITIIEGIVIDNGAGYEEAGSEMYML